ncbi:tannase/feruloyl esterase family alpha/beta hydrolase [Amycolatopsis sp. cmx-11-51]|uniref:tannase/feruloyl esterase family alpha/beta hydrolase n=1 Tax=Amycolatopsis sp. cmx-11-51 TaxID=2785797 RepID=UPI0039E32DD5
MKVFRTAAVVTPLLATLVMPLAAHAQQSASGLCADLDGVQIPAAAISLPTSGGQVTATRLVAATATIGEYCSVDAAIRPVDPNAPRIKMQLALPTQWNHSSLMFGGGGYDGTIPNIAGNVPFGPADQPVPLARGYAVFASDSGHQATPGFPPSTTLDGSFGLNDEAVRNFAGDALKKTRDTAVHLISRRYPGAHPAHSFFAGGSTGGREALAVAQRWPTAFDGVIAVYPAWNAASLDLFFGYETRVLSQPGAFLNPAEQAVLYRGVIDACDRRDGLTDGVVSNPDGCHYHPWALRCPGGKDTADTCLSDTQINAVVRLSSPLYWNYRLGSGERGYPGFPFLSGAKMSTPLLGMGTQAPAHPMPTTAGYGPQFWDQWTRYFVTRDPSFNSLTLDPRAPGEWKQRISDLSQLQDVNNPDLRPFARAGGKLLMLHGAADELVSSRSTAEYFGRVQRTVGRQATDRFARFYVVPGANHVNVGAAFAAGWDSLGALETWTGQGKAPVHPVVTDVNPTAGQRTRPLCQYPTWPRYTGGDPDNAHSFTCQR